MASMDFHTFKISYFYVRNTETSILNQPNVMPTIQRGTYLLEPCICFRQTVSVCEETDRAAFRKITHKETQDHTQIFPSYSTRAFQHL